MDLTLKKKKRSTLFPFLILLLLLLALLALRSMFAETSANIVHSVTSLETVEQILEQVKDENSDISANGGNKKKPSIKEEIEQSKSRLSKSEYKSAKSNYNRMVEHVNKLEKYKQNPMEYDNLELLKNAPTEQIKQKII